MHGIAGADAGNHAHRVSRLDLIDVDHARRLKDAKVRSLLGFRNQAAQVWLGTISQVVLLDSAIAKVKQSQAETKLAVGRAFHHAMALKNHEKAVGRAFVQLQRRSNLRQSERRAALTEQIQDRKGPVKRLHFVNTLRSGVAHIGPLFHFSNYTLYFSKYGMAINR